ncbi:FkbM family methyltransferase [Flavitalea sp. BT771]|uniref:FkbM family methyltransferase n=1 Tax=Flavitalea sp. BT771 TaxID=3063329 RepID=UPI0026E316DE|nr:FkbM family methyltransferase [Flavitalea sp. BT771]MDO6434625.1 FkbM family methyltransferase [Flavitalea sp. BT771]MDV6223525.1 FkbM family methyltransferase [Flavitalea sp. BT771]
MDTNLIFDLGLHKGEDSEFYLKKGFRVVGVEASEELCRISRVALKKYIDNGQMRIVNCAVGDKDGDTISFYKNTSISVWGTVDINWAKRNEMFGAQSIREQVRTVRLDTLIRKFGMPYYMKIDIEGTDLLAIRQLTGLHERPKYLSIESEKISWQKLLDECSVLKTLGYTNFKIINQKYIQQQKCPEISLEGQFVHHVFKEGSSGLFGGELPGKWMTLEECIKTYRRLFRMYRLFGDYGYFNNKFCKSILHKMRIGYPDVGWYDTHATF